MQHPEDYVFAFQPLKARATHILLVVFLALAALGASIVLPSVRAAAAPVGTSATIHADACASDARIRLSNQTAAEQSFDLWQYGDRVPYASVRLAPNVETTVSRTLEETSQRLSVRINGAALADQVVSRVESCADVLIPVLPGTADGVSAEILPPNCSTTAVVRLNNGTQDSKSFAVERESSKVIEQQITVTRKAVLSATIDIPVVDIVRVKTGGKVIGDATLTAAAACVATVKTSGLDTAFGDWGKPVRVDDFSGDLAKGAGGWSVYDSPRNASPRSKDNVRTSAEIETGELQLVGAYDRAKGKQMGAGLAQNYGQKYGRWEVRARTDKGAGFSPTILLWPHKGTWPDDGEIDLLEGPKGNRLNAIAVLHNGPANRFRSHGLAGDHSEWHTYAVEWLPSRVTFYLDGIEQWTVTDKSLIPSTAGMHLAMQMDSGCGWIQCPNGETKPETVMHVDWIKIFEARGSMLD